MKLIELALVKAGLSPTEPDTSELNPGSTMMVSAMNDMRVFAHIFTCPQPTDCAPSPVALTGFNDVFRDKIVGYSQSKNLDGAPHPTFDVIGESITRTPSNGYGWWNLNSVFGTDYISYGPDGVAIGHSLLTSVNATTQISTSGLLSQSHFLMVLYAAIMVALWNQNLKAAAYLIDVFEERLKYALQPIDGFGSMRVPQNGVIPAGVQQQ